MNSRLQALIDRGYPKEDVLWFSSFTDEELNAAAKAAFKHISRNCTSVSNPEALFVGGQPGCGKSSMSLNIKNRKKNIIEIGIDNYRMYHPKYLEMEEYIKKHWEGKEETINDSPGNDIADMTHVFAGAMTDKLIDLAKKRKFNMLLEWGMREPEAPLKTMKQLKENGYHNIVMFVVTNKDLSYAACNLRSDILTNSPHIIRKVPKSFHDLCIETLPDSINAIYEAGKINNCYDYLAVVDRKGHQLWKENMPIKPGQVFKEYLDKVDLKDVNDASLASIINDQEMYNILNNEQKITITSINPVSIFDNVSKR